jgi:hypothetical protein
MPALSEYQFDRLVDLMKTIAWHATGSATHQARAGGQSALDEAIEETRQVLCEEE